VCRIPLVVLRRLIDFDLLDGEVGIHGRRLLNGLGQRFVVVDRIAVRLDCDLQKNILVIILRGIAA
jgi:hypothetical protein